MTRYTKSMREAMEEVWANDITLDEGKMKTIATMFADGKSASEIAKKMKLPLSTVKTILGEEDIAEAMLWEFSDGQIAKLIGSTKGTVSLIRNRTFWNFSNLTARDPVILGLCTQLNFEKAIGKANRKKEREKKLKEKEEKLKAKEEKKEQEASNENQ